MTTIIQKMWRDGVPGPDGGLVQITPRIDPMQVRWKNVWSGAAERMPVYKCSNCDTLSYNGVCVTCNRILFKEDQL